MLLFVLDIRKERIYLTVHNMLYKLTWKIFFICHEARISCFLMLYERIISSPPIPVPTMHCEVAWPTLSEECNPNEDECAVSVIYELTFLQKTI